MKNIKFVAICAASGFILSLICGFFSKSGFGRIFLIALLFGVIFGGLSFGISLIYDKFLDVEASGAENPAGSEGFSVAAAPEKKTLGQHVNIIIQEEPLEQSGNTNHYDVGENHQMLNESDYKNTGKKENKQETEEQIIPKDEFVPIRNFETVNNFSGNEASTPVEAEHRREVIAAQEEKKSGDLDVLPDMTEFKVASDSGNGEDDTVELSDSDESSFVRSATDYKSSDGNEMEAKDASLMAKAISSILAEET